MKREARLIIPGQYAFLIGLVTVMLKVTGQIDWDWWVILLPFYFPYAITFATIAMLVIGTFVVWAIGVIVFGIVALCCAAFDVWDHIRRK